MIVFAFSAIASTNCVVDRPLHEDAAAGRAHLALIDEHAEERAVDGRLEIGVGEEDVRRLAAELERDLLQRAGGAAHDDAADFGAAGERDLVDVRRARRSRRRPSSPSPVTMLTTPGGRPASAKLDASSSTESGVCSAGFRTIVHPAQIAGRHLPRRHQQRIVPWHDLAGDADRLAQREADRVVGHRQHVAVDLRRETAVVLEARRDVRHVELGLDDRLAAVARFDLGQLVGTVADDLGELEQHAAAILRGSVLPRALVERLARGLHCAVDILRVRVRHRCDDFRGGGIDDVDCLARRRVDIFAVDVKLICFHAPKPPLYSTNTGAGNEHRTRRRRHIRTSI